MDFVFQGLAPVDYGPSIKANIELYSNFLKLKDWAVDIGSNAGDTSLPMRQLVGPEGKVICFEPIPAAFNQLNSNILNNNYTNFDCHNYFCDDHYGMIGFGIGQCPDNGGIMEGFSLEYERGHSCHVVQLPCVDTSDFLIQRYAENLEKIKFIKIDCEGYDYKVFLSLKPLLDIIKPVILTEWWVFQDKHKLLFDAIAEIGYIPYRIDNLELAKLGQSHCHDLILKPL